MEMTEERKEKMRLGKEASAGQGNLNPTEKALANPNSMRFAINAKCWDCCCFQRVEVTRCEITSCPLWNFRPWQRKK